MVAFWVGYGVLSWLAADFIAGLFHWWEDQYVEQDWPIVGTLVGGPNAEHHASPTRFLRGSYWHRNWTTIVPALVGALVMWFIDPWCVLPLLLVSQANEIHGWSHQKCNPLIRCLQETEFITSVRHHAVHHVDPFSRRYCVMSGWLNPILDGIRFWTMLEVVGLWLFRAQPKHSYSELRS